MLALLEGIEGELSIGVGICVGEDVDPDGVARVLDCCRARPGVIV